MDEMFKPDPLVHTCPQVDDPRGREYAMVVIEPKTDESKGVWCDPCLVPLVKALNDGGLRTLASCCGHRVGDAKIVVEVDGRHIELVVQAEPENVIGYAVQERRKHASDSQKWRTSTEQGSIERAREWIETHGLASYEYRVAVLTLLSERSE